jgi:hypothetical protein
MGGSSEEQRSVRRVVEPRVNTSREVFHTPALSLVELV